MSNYDSSTRAQIIKRRTYNRPKKDGTYETWDETVDRVIQHQRWLWERAKKMPLDTTEIYELEQLRHMILNHYVSVSGRTLWLGGTPISKKYEATQFNCSAKQIRTVYDVCDGYHLLLQGVGLGFEAKTGALFGFSKQITDVEIIPSTRDKSDKGCKYNYEVLKSRDHWYLRIGDSSNAWAKSVGKILAMKHRVSKITLDFSEIRGSGSILSNYGWISSGYQPLERAMRGIINILNEAVGKMLDEIQIMDIMNHIGSTLSSRRSAELCLMKYENKLSEKFAKIKHNHWIDNPQRSQSNNSLLFEKKPTKEQLTEIFKWMVESGGSEPGFINGEALKKNAPWASLLNPCCEIKLEGVAGSFCNLVEINLLKCNELDEETFKQYVYFIARANYRQTCVNLKDGFLQDSWHESNDFLRLCGVGLTGIVQWKHLNEPEKFRQLKKWVIDGCDSMADELGLNRAFLKTTVKPSGSLSCILSTEKLGAVACGVHKPLSKYIHQNIRFSINDPLVEQLRKCNYNIFPDPYNANESVLITIPVKYENIEFDNVNGKEINIESAIVQLERYKMLMENYVEHNCSVTISYDPSEVPDIVDWFMKDENWNIYVGVSFLFRSDPSLDSTALGYPYLPQDPVDKETYEKYVSTLLPFELDKKEKDKMFSLDIGGCATGACPIR